MTARITTAIEHGSERPCQVGRLTYKVGAYSYVALTFRYLDEPMPSRWALTWIGHEGEDSVRLPLEWAIEPPTPMLDALAEATG